MKPEVSKEIKIGKKDNKKKKVADLPKKKKLPTKSVTGFSRGMGLFFIGIIGILAGLLLFNLIINFSVSDVMDQSLLASYNSGASGKVVKTTTFKPESASALYFTFDYATTSTVSYFTKGGDTFGAYVIDGTPTFRPEGVAVTPVASFEFSRDSVDDTVTRLLAKGGTSKKVDVDGTNGVEVSNPNDKFTYLVFGNKGVVYVGKFSTEKAFLAESTAVKSSIKLTK